MKMTKSKVHVTHASKLLHSFLYLCLVIFGVIQLSSYTWILYFGLLTKMLKLV